MFFCTGANVGNGGLLFYYRRQVCVRFFSFYHGAGRYKWTCGGFYGFVLICSFLPADSLCCFVNPRKVGRQVDLFVEWEDRAKQGVFRGFRGSTARSARRRIPRLFFVFDPSGRLHSLRRELRRSDAYLECLRRTIGLGHRVLFAFGVRCRSSCVQFVRQPRGLNRRQGSATSHRDGCFIFVAQCGFFSCQGANEVGRHLGVVKFSVTILQGEVGGPAGTKCVCAGGFGFQGDEF